MLSKYQVNKLFGFLGNNKESPYFCFCMVNGETRYILLKECADIRVGQTFKGALEHQPTGDVKVIQPRDLEEGILSTELRRVERGNIPVISNHLLRPGELLIANKGTRLGTFLYNGEPRSAIATSSFFVISPYQRILPTYLYWYLNQPPARGYFATHSSGTTIPAITKSILGDLPIPVVSTSIQDHIGELHGEMVRERNLLKLYMEMKRDYCNSYIWEQIINSGHEKTT